MKNTPGKLYLTFIFFVIFFYLSNCSSGNRKIIPPDKLIQKENHLVLWVHSDIQPRDPSELHHYELAAKDIRDNISYVYAAIVAGDIVHYSRTPNVYEWFLKTREIASVKRWFEIAGNHDAKDFYNYKKYIKKPLYYSVRIGNILILLMSDEANSPPQDISNNTFNWWKDNVINNQDCIIITVTHAYLKQSDLFGSIESTRNIIDSDRFAGVLEKYRVDVWIAGHLHWPNYMPGNVEISDELNGTLFINVATIRKDIINYISSCIFFFAKGSDYLIIKNRDHEEREYQDSQEVRHHLSHKFEWDGAAPSIIFPQ